MPKEQKQSTEEKEIQEETIEITDEMTRDRSLVQKVAIPVGCTRLHGAAGRHRHKGRL